MHGLHQEVDPVRIQAIQNMAARADLIRQGELLSPHPWTMVGGYPGFARQLTEVSGELTDEDLLKICRKLGMSPELSGSILVSNADRFYTVLSKWLRAGTPVVELGAGVESALRGEMASQRVAESTKTVRKNPGTYVVTGFDDRLWFHHLVHHHAHSSPSVSFSIRQILSRLSRIHVFVDSSEQGLRFMVCAFDLIDMDWQVPLSMFSFFGDEWMEHNTREMRDRPYQYKNPWFLSLIGENTPPEQSMFWVIVAFGVFVPLLGSAVTALAAALSACQVKVAPPSVRPPSRRDRRERISTGPEIRRIWLDPETLSSYVRSTAPALPQNLSRLTVECNHSLPRATHTVCGHVARYWVVSPNPNEVCVDRRTEVNGRVLYCVERPRRAHVRGHGEVRIGRTQRLGLTKSTQSNISDQEART